MWRIKRAAYCEYGNFTSVKLTKETKNKTFVLRIEQEQMDALEKWAADKFRSINGQILYLLEQALVKSGRKPKKKKSLS